MSADPGLPPAAKVYRTLLWLYPMAHRLAYGDAMLLHVGDLERDARRDGRWRLLWLYPRLIFDAIRSAGAEHLEAIMSNNRFTPASWLAVFLAAIPGLLLMLSRTDLVQPGSQLIPVLVRLGYLTFLLIAIPLLWVRRQRFPEWALMMAGLLTWMAFYLAGTLLSTLWNASGTALTRMVFFQAEQVKSQIRPGIEQTAGLSEVLIAILQAKPNDRIIQNRHDVTGISEGQTGSIFLQGHIPAVMQPGFDLPILANQCQ